MLKKIRHLAETAPQTIVYTDHGAALGITKQIGLSSSSIKKLNLRLVRASSYIQIFRNLEFRHKPGVSYKISDALSRLSNKSHQDDDSEEVLDALWAYAYTATALVEISPEFKARIVKGYQDDVGWKRIDEILIKNNAMEKDAVKLPFIKNNEDLI